MFFVQWLLHSASLDTCNKSGMWYSAHLNKLFDAWKQFHQVFNKNANNLNYSVEHISNWPGGTVYGTVNFPNCVQKQGCVIKSFIFLSWNM